jgi:putative transposase
MFHVTFRAAPGTSPFENELGNAVWDSLLRESADPAVSVLAACLMPDHLHLLVAPADGDLLAWLARLKSLTTRAAWAHGFKGALWQPRFHDRAVRAEEAGGVLAYVLNNPVAAGLAAEPGGWPWVRVWGD